MMKNILVPTDFSPASKSGIKYALEIAELTGAAVHIVNFMSITDELSADVNQLSENIDRIKKLVDDFEPSEVKIFTKIMTQCIQDGVKIIEREMPVDLMVIGIDNHTTVGDRFCHSQGIEDLKTPVIICNEDYDCVAKLEEMLAGIDVKEEAVDDVELISVLRPINTQLSQAS